MKTVILCGGRGTRLDEMGKVVPKALFPIGHRPLIWHVLKIYVSQGFEEFVLCLGFLGERIIEYFQELSCESKSDVYSIDHPELKCTVSLFETGQDTNTGGRIKNIQQAVAGENRFFVTYGDGLANVDLRSLLDFHTRHGRTASVTTVHPTSNFGIVEIDDGDRIVRFREKPRMAEWINGGFFVFEKQIFELLSSDSVLECEPLETLTARGELMAFKHNGFWKCMDTFKDNLELNQLWDERAPWKTW